MPALAVAAGQQMLVDAAIGAATQALAPPPPAEDAPGMPESPV